MRIDKGERLRLSHRAGLAYRPRSGEIVEFSYWPWRCLKWGDVACSTDSVGADGVPGSVRWGNDLVLIGRDLSVSPRCRPKRRSLTSTLAWDIVVPPPAKELAPVRMSQQRRCRTEIRNELKNRVSKSVPTIPHVGKRPFTDISEPAAGARFEPR